MTVSETETAGIRSILLVWVALVLVLNVVRWIGGFPSGMLAEAVERGVARAEAQGKGEVGDDLIRKAIRTQRETLSFWSVLAAIDDFLVEPAVLALRAVLAATLFTGIAALSGRTPQYDRALAESARDQGFWVLGLAVRVALMILLRRGETDVETSAALVLPAGSYHATIWKALRQLDLFAIIGWVAIARGGWRRGDSSLPVAVAIGGGLGLAEWGLRIAVGLVLGAAIRLSLVVK